MNNVKFLNSTATRRAVGEVVGPRLLIPFRFLETAARELATRSGSSVAHQTENPTVESALQGSAQVPLRNRLFACHD